MSDFTLSPPILAAILCNAPPLVLAPPPDNYCTVPKMENSSSIKLSNPRWRMVSDPSLTMNYVTMTSLFPRLEGKKDGISILLINSTI